MAYRYRPRVTLSVPPEHGDLDCWGLDVGDEWWALVLWDVWVKLPGEHPRAVGCAAWVGGATVSQPMQPIYYLHVPRIKLGAEPALWPGPRSRPDAHWPATGAYYFGALDHGQKPELPPEAGEVGGKGTHYFR